MLNDLFGGMSAPIPVFVHKVDSGISISVGGCGLIPRVEPNRIAAQKKRCTKEMYTDIANALFQ